MPSIDSDTWLRAPTTRLSVERLLDRVCGRRLGWLADADDWAKLHMTANYSQPMLAKQSLRVLVVEDEALLRWSLAEMLRRGGHTVMEAVSAGTARGALSSTPAPIDVIFLDYRLPDSTDLRLLEEIRRDTPRSAVVLMTAYATPEVVQGALERGAYCVISKPFDLHDMDTLVHDAHRAGRPH